MNNLKSVKLDGVELKPLEAWGGYYGLDPAYQGEAIFFVAMNADGSPDLGGGLCEVELVCNHFLKAVGELLGRKYCPNDFPIYECLCAESSAWEKRIAQLEHQGLTRSDAQGAAEAEFRRKNLWDAKDDETTIEASTLEHNGCPICARRGFEKSTNFKTISQEYSSGVDRELISSKKECQECKTLFLVLND